MNFRTYSELIALQTFEERFEYLRLDGEIGKETFGFDRIFNQMFYNSREWKMIRDHVIVRDGANEIINKLAMKYMGKRLLFIILIQYR